MNAKYRIFDHGEYLLEFEDVNEAFKQANRLCGSSDGIVVEFVIAKEHKFVTEHVYNAVIPRRVWEQESGEEEQQ